MEKDLSRMSLEELWRLFPICLTAHQSCWKDWYREEEALLRSALPAAKRISHIGSTAVEGIWAKPTVDILLEVGERDDFEALAIPLKACGYRIMSRSDRRMSLNKGYTPQGFAERVFHLHVRRVGEHDELYFRDYLIEHPEVAQAYESLKLALWKRYEHDRDGYTSAKEDFVREYTRRARESYGERYESTCIQDNSVPPCP